MPSFATLPIELYHLIAEQLNSQSDISHLARTSWDLHQGLESIFYREFSLRWRHEDIWEQSLRGFDKYPQRYAFVSKFEVQWNMPVKDTQVLQALALFLRQVTNLRHLILDTCQPDLGVLLDDCTFQLHIFESSGDHNAYLPILFGSQPTIRHLAVQYFSKQDELSLDLLPHLCILEGPGNLCSAVTPGRSIERLSWTSTAAQSLMDGGPFPSLQVLRLADKIVDLTMANTSDEIAPNLRYLEGVLSWKRVRTSPRFAALRGPMGYWQRNDLRVYLRRLSHIHTLYLSVAGGNDEWNWERAQEYLQKLFSVALSLQIVQFHFHPKWGGKRWLGRRGEILRDVSETDFGWRDWLTWSAPGLTF